MQTQKSYDQYFNIVRRYEILLNKIKNMYSKSSNSISGYFNNENLEIGINGIKDQYLKGALQNIERYIHNADNKELQKNINISESIHIQGIKDWLIYYQVLAHESFHLLQSLTLQTTSEYVYWIRQFRDYEFMAYVVNLSSGATGKCININQFLILCQI